jgi:outer membrane immunogenic protein
MRRKAGRPATETAGTFNWGALAMKKLFSISGIAVAVALAWTGSATAADMPVKAAPPPPPAFTWTGWYIGLNGGGIWGETTGNFAPLFPNFPWQADISQGIAGVTTGTNWQIGQFVIGTESNYDVGLGDPGTTAANGIAGPCGFAAGVQSCQSRINDLFTFGGRLGWAGSGLIGNGNWLLFAQGGWAYANISTNGLTNATNTQFSQSQAWHNGWFAGVGLDYALSNVVSVGVDYKHYEFDTKAHLDGAGAVNNNRMVSATADAVFARINFKLTGPGTVLGCPFGFAC